MSNATARSFAPTPTTPALLPLPRVDEPARPFLKWVGGKRRLVTELLRHIPADFGTYHEPFLGGGALFYALAEGLPPEAGATLPWASLSDMNLRLIRAYRGVRDDVEGVIERLAGHAAANCEAHYYAVRAAEIDSAEDDAEVAAWLIYLNKTGYNGLYRVNNKGRFNVPWGRYANPNICDEPNLRAVSRTLMGADIEHRGYEAVLDRAEPGDVVYFDPPYVPVSDTASFTAYTQAGFGMSDQVRLRDVAVELKRRGVTILLSNSDTPLTRELYCGELQRRTALMPRSINCSADKRGAVAELIVW